MTAPELVLPCFVVEDVGAYGGVFGDPVWEDGFRGKNGEGGRDIVGEKRVYPGVEGGHRERGESRDELAEYVVS